MAAQLDSGLQTRLVGSFQEFFSIVKELDQLSNSRDTVVSNEPVVDRLRKTSLAINEETQKLILERFGIASINMENIEQVYNVKYSGIGSLAETRRYLIKKGMTAEFADNLAKRYLNRLESSSQVFSIMDLFNTK